MSRCLRCQRETWQWNAGTAFAPYFITVCDGCLEITMPPSASLFDSGAEYMRRAEELRAMLAQGRIEAPKETAALVLPPPSH